MTVDFKNRKQVIKTFAGRVSLGKVKFYGRYGLTLVPHRREGAYLYDINGRQYLNLHCNGGVFNLGHRNPQVIEALLRGLETYDIGNHHLVSGPKAVLAQKLAECLPGELNHAVFGVSGGEAIDLSIKLARATTGRPGIISAQGGYHGHTGFALAAGDGRFKAPFGPLAPGFSHVPFDDIAALERAISEETAAVIMEPVPATLGMRIPHPDYFREVRNLCDQRGAIFIADEVQTGLGRTGKPWAIEHFGVAPDILVTGKGLSGGIYPITATCINDRVYDFVVKNPFIHISTFGGSDLGCLAALEVLRITMNEDFLAEVIRKAAHFRQNLESVQQKHASVFKEIRQLGLFMGLRFTTGNFAMVLSKVLFDNGLYAIYSANDKRVMQFLPPLIITDEEIDRASSILDTALRQIQRNLKYRGLKFLADRLAKDPV